jgi:hypothetical protein
VHGKVRMKIVLWLQKILPFSPAPTAALNSRNELGIVAILTQNILRAIMLNSL